MENGKADESKRETIELDKPAADIPNDEAVEEKKNPNDKETVEKEIVEASPELLDEIKSQIEFYFGDINMQRDKFLIEQTKLNEGWVPMAVMLNFKALAALSEHIPTILKAIENSELMEISEDKKNIRRRLNKPLPIYDENYRKAATERTIYVKGFPLQDIDINKLKKFFKDYEPFENIVMRKYKDNKKVMQFKGSIFVQFKTLDDAKAFMARESVKYNDQELIRMFSSEYNAVKEKEREEKKAKSSEKSKNSEKAPAKEETAAAAAEAPSIDLPKGSVLKFTGTSNSTDWDTIKSSLVELEAKIAYVDYKIGASHGWLRLQVSNSANTLLEKMTDNKLTIDGSEVTFKVLEGEEEEQYLKKVKNDMMSRKQRMQKGNKGRGKRGHGKKRPGSPVKNDVPAKKVSAN